MLECGSKLALGSANFGLDYGLANHSGKLTKTELEEILFEANSANIRIIDTAQAYGDSEARIGSLCITEKFNIVTKIGIGSEKDYVKGKVKYLVKQSCERLKQPRLYAVMLHQPEILLSDIGDQIIKELQILKEQNIIFKVGVSIYSPEILEEISKFLQLDIVQLPFNIFDQQILSSGWINKLKNNGTEIHTRSAFLQGLLLMQQSSLPSYFTNTWPSLFNSWYNFLETNGVDALYVALNFVLKQDWIDKVVVGVDSASQLKTLLEVEKSLISMDFPQLGCDDTNLINPSKWAIV